MRKRSQIILQIFIGVATILTLSAGKALSTTAQAEAVSSSPTTQLAAFSGVRDGAEAAKANDMPEKLVGTDGAFTKITNAILYAVGIISVIMLVYGGIRYIVSGGDNKKVTDARNTILYAIIGLVIALLAYAIVNFILNTIGTGETTIETTTEQVEETTE